MNINIADQFYVQLFGLSPIARIEGFLLDVEVVVKGRAVEKFQIETNQQETIDDQLPAILAKANCEKSDLLAVKIYGCEEFEKPLQHGK